jgi:hypothetical protein
MSNLNGPSWDEATRDERISQIEKIPAPTPIAPKPTGTGNLGSSTLVLTKIISADRWRRAEDAFYKQVEVTRHGQIQNLRGGILAAVKELLS